MVDTALLADPEYRIPSFVEYAAFAARTESSPVTFAVQIVQPFPASRACFSTFDPTPEPEWGTERFDVGANDDLIRLVHAVVGLCTESGEILAAWAKHRHQGKTVDMTNVKEEIGDCFWYVPIALEVCATDFAWVDAHIVAVKDDKALGGDKVGELIDGLSIRAAHLLEIAVKKRLFYPKPLNEEECLQGIGEFIDVLVRLCFRLGFDPYDVMTANVRKLSVRYSGDGFSTQHAVERDTDAETAQIDVSSTPGQYHEEDGVEPETGRVMDIRVDGAVLASEYAQANPDAVFYPGYGFKAATSPTENVTTAGNDIAVGGIL